MYANTTTGHNGLGDLEHTIVDACRAEIMAFHIQLARTPDQRTHQNPQRRE